MAYQAGYAAAADTIVLVAEIRDSVSAHLTDINRGIADFAAGAETAGQRGGAALSVFGAGLDQLRQCFGPLAAEAADSAEQTGEAWSGALESILDQLDASFGRIDGFFSRISRGMLQYLELSRKLSELTPGSIEYKTLAESRYTLLWSMIGGGR